MLSSVQRAAFDSQLVTKTLYLVYLAIGEYVTVSVSTSGFIYAGSHVTQRLREEYLAAVMRQNIAFFDTLGTGEIINCITADLNLIQEGISEKVGLTITGFTTFFAAFVIGFAMYWSRSHHYDPMCGTENMLMKLRIDTHSFRNFLHAYVQPVPNVYPLEKVH